MKDMDITLSVTISNMLDAMVDDRDNYNFGDGYVATTFQSADLKLTYVVLSDGQVLEVSVKQVAPPRR